VTAGLVHVHEMLSNSQKTTKLRSWSMVGLGAASGMVMGRLLPILIANANGAVRARFGEDPFAGLIREHRQLLALLDKMENTRQPGSLRRGTLFYMFKRKIAKHAMAEEDVVYPMLRDSAERADAVRKLYEEHGRMKVLLFELEESINDDQGWVKAVGSLRNEIEPHARQEEEVEFPALRARIDMPGKVKLARKIQQEEAAIV
jgi:iron-sulfur cluster repair protein YtfE (RIC family)